MFNHHQHHQQQQQQFQQHLRQLQQLFQHQQPPPPPPPPPAPPSLPPPSSHHIPHHHQAPRPMTSAAPAPPPPPPRMVNLCSPTQATIIAANPMLQGALLMQQMQGNLRGFGMGNQPFTQFFPAGARPSLLGPAPMGVAIKTPLMGFPPRPFNLHPRYFNKDFPLRPPERKRESEQRLLGSSDLQPAGSSTEGENTDRPVDTSAAQSVEVDIAQDGGSQPSSEELGEPAVKKSKVEEREKTTVEETSELESDLRPNYSLEEESGDIPLEVGGSTAGTEAVEFVEESRAAEVLGVGTSLKVTIQQSSESRAFSTGLEELAGAVGVQTGNHGDIKDPSKETSCKFFCYICNITCHNQQNFQSHMNGLAHQQRMMEIQHMSNACLVTLLPRVQESLQGACKDGEKRLGLQRWCATCQRHFTGDLIEHRRTKEHKLSKHSSRPFCTVCRRHFRTPRKFVEHMKSPEHKQRVEELREDCDPEILEELITVDAVGCFEGEEDYEEEPDEEEELDETIHDDSHLNVGLPAQKEVALEEMTDNEQYDQDTQYGSSFVVPVAGFLCRLCHKFYHFESTARHSHCKSLTHFQNLQKYRALRRQDDNPASENTADVRSCSSTTTSHKSPHKQDRSTSEEINSDGRNVDAAVSHILSVNPSVSTVSSISPQVTLELLSEITKLKADPRSCSSAAAVKVKSKGASNQDQNNEADTTENSSDQDATSSGSSNLLLTDSLEEDSGIPCIDMDMDEEGKLDDAGANDASQEEKPVVGPKQSVNRRRSTRSTRKR